MYRSTDGGVSWQTYGNDVNPYSLAVDPVSTSTLYAGGHVGVFRSADAGASWSLVSQRIEVGALAVDPAVPTRVYAGTEKSVFVHDFD